MNDYIKVLVKRAGFKPHFAVIKNELAYFQALVQGHIEIFPLSMGCLLICNEEGKLNGLPHCCTIYGEEIVGNIVVCGQDGEEFGDFPMELMEAKRMFPELWEVF